MLAVPALGRPSAPGAADTATVSPTEQESDIREAPDDIVSSGASTPAPAFGLDNGAEVPLGSLAPLAIDPTQGAVRADDSDCLPLESLCGDAESLHSAGSLQHIVTQPGSLAAAAAAAGVPPGAQLQPQMPVNSMGAILHMSPVIPTPFSQASPPLEEGAGLTDTMQRLPTAAVLPSVHSAGLYTVPPHPTDMRSNQIYAEAERFSATPEPSAWPGISDAQSDGLSAATAATGAPSPVQLPDPSMLWPQPPAALLSDPDVKPNGSGVRLTPSPKKHHIMWAQDGPSWASRPDATVAADRHAYADADGDWLSEPESSADSASSRLTKRPRQVTTWSGLDAYRRRADVFKILCSEMFSCPLLHLTQTSL